MKGKEVWRSKVMREAMPPEPVAVDLEGADEILLKVDNADDGISCDQADWAEAKVVLADGKTVWLGDLPVTDFRKMPRVGPPFSFSYGGTPSSLLLKSWQRELKTKKLGREPHRDDASVHRSRHGLGRHVRGDSVPRFPHG